MFILDSQIYAYSIKNHLLNADANFLKEQEADGKNLKFGELIELQSNRLYKIESLNDAYLVTKEITTAFEPVYSNELTSLIKCMKDVESTVNRETKSKSNYGNILSDNFKLKTKNVISTGARRRSHNQLVEVSLKFFKLIQENKVLNNINNNGGNDQNIVIKRLNTFCKSNYTAKMLTISGGLFGVVLKGTKLFGDHTKLDQANLKYSDCVRMNYTFASDSFLKIIRYFLEEGYRTLISNHSPLEEHDVYSKKVETILKAGSNLSMLKWARNEDGGKKDVATKKNKKRKIHDVEVENDIVEDVAIGMSTGLFDLTHEYYLLITDLNTSVSNSKKRKIYPFDQKKITRNTIQSSFNLEIIEKYLYKLSKPTLEQYNYEYNFEYNYDLDKIVLNSSPDSVINQSNQINLYRAIKGVIMKNVSEYNVWSFDKNSIDFRFVPSLLDATKFLEKVNALVKTAVDSTTIKTIDVKTLFPDSKTMLSSYFSILTKQPNEKSGNNEYTLLMFFIQYAVHKYFNENIPENKSRKSNSYEKSSNARERSLFIGNLLNTLFIEFLNYFNSKVLISPSFQHNNHKDSIQINRMIYIIGKFSSFLNCYTILFFLYNCL